MGATARGNPMPQSPFALTCTVQGEAMCQASDAGKERTVMSDNTNANPAPQPAADPKPVNPVMEDLKKRQAANAKRATAAAAKREADKAAGIEKPKEEGHKVPLTEA